jgi:hypothetical protein
LPGFLGFRDVWTRENIASPLYTLFQTLEKKNNEVMKNLPGFILTPPCQLAFVIHM